MEAVPTVTRPEPGKGGPLRSVPAGALFGSLVIVILALVGFLALDYRCGKLKHLSSTGLVTSGVVVSVERHSARVCRGCIRPFVRFRPADGGAERGFWGLARPGYAVGDVVPVIYDPSDPDNVWLLRQLRPNPRAPAWVNCGW
jgi:hypothetical protein